MITFSKLGKLGRRGNQFFQVAVTIGQAISCKVTPSLPISEKKNWEGFNIPDSYFSNYISSNKYNEPAFHYNKIPNQNDLDLNGYFQSEKYFKHCKDEVRKALTPKKVIKHSGMTALHVRRTDYLTHKDCYHILDRKKYYNAAMNIISGPYLIFSDDIEWCKKEFIGNDFYFSEETDPIKDLSNMIGCDNFIIGNSSFSWWGSWLSTRKDKVIVAPKLWFGPTLNKTHDTKDLYCKDWVLV